MRHWHITLNEPIPGSWDQHGPTWVLSAPGGPMWAPCKKIITLVPINKEMWVFHRYWEYFTISSTHWPQRHCDQCIMTRRHPWKHVRRIDPCDVIISNVFRHIKINEYTHFSHFAVMRYSTSICKLDDIIPTHHQSNCLSCPSWAWCSRFPCMGPRRQLLNCHLL